MGHLQAAWSAVTKSPRRAAVAAAVAAGAIAVGVSVAVVGFGDPREVAGAPNTSPSATMSDLSSSSAEPTLVPTQTPTPSATATPTPAPSPTPVATNVPTPTAPPPVTVHWPLGMAAQTITENLVVRSRPGTGDDSVLHQPFLPEGTHMRLAEGPVSASGYSWYRVTGISATLAGGIDDGWIAAGDKDGVPWIAPSSEGCLEWEFPSADITIDSLAELEAEFRATWGGCVITPWIPPYPVIITFRDDGTYSATGFAASGDPALYYGTDAESPQKRYALNDLQDSLKGVGQIDIVFGGDSLNRGDLRNVKLMGHQLEFEFFHRGDYGPLTFRLYRIADF